MQHRKDHYEILDSYGKVVYKTNQLKLAEHMFKQLSYNCYSLHIAKTAHPFKLCKVLQMEHTLRSYE